MTNPFYRLAPFIQDFIYREKWETLREVQVKAIEAVLDTPNHILIMSGTATGKTEAAFLPVLTELYERPSKSIGVLYIGPLKALINDQFYRLQKLLEEGGIPVQSWHGDVAQSKKEKFIRNAQGVLQITPESLEAMLINRQIELSRLFGDLRFVIIDEIHAFIGSDRGRQVMCQLQRLARYQARPPRRIGLSATIGEPDLAIEWLAGGTTNAVTLINDPRGRRGIMLGLEHFICIDEEEEDTPEPHHEPLIPQPALIAPPDLTEISSLQPPLIADQTDDLFKHMYQMVESVRKTLVFANTRNETEEIIQNLRRLANVESEEDDSYYVHHGSISAALRERAEEDMRNPEKQACVAATITLELGIDLGSLDQVLQLNAPNTVSSFVQRLGRSGRRGDAAKMFFYSREEGHEDDASLGERIPWDFLQTIAIVQLYMEERWVEPPDIPQLPLSLLYHQTMSVITAQTELTPPDLAEQILTLSPFAHVGLDQYRTLLRHLLDINHLEKVDGGGLIIGTKAERIVNNYRFYATFKDESAYLVRDGTREVGTIQSMPMLGGRFRLAGRSWEVVGIDEEKRVIQVERVKGKAQAHWEGSGAPVHTNILRRIRRVLEEDTNYGYLQHRAIDRLHQARQLAQSSQLTRQACLPLGGSRLMLLPWQGTRIMDTLGLLLEYTGISVRDVGKPYYLEVNIGSVDELKARVQALLAHNPSAEALAERLPPQALDINKYDRYVPERLLRSAYALDGLDMQGATTWLNMLIQ